MLWSEGKHQFLNQLAAETTRKGYLQNLVQFERYLKNQKIQYPFHVETVNKVHIEKYLTYLELEKKCKASTCQRHFYALSSFFTYAFNEEWIKVRPTIGVVLKEPDKQVPIFITSTECSKLSQTIKNPVIAMAVRFQFETGLRVAECLALHLDDVDFEKNVIFVKEGKGGKDRTVPINSDFAKKLANYVNSDRTEVNSSFLFATKRTGRLSSTYVNREIKKAVKMLGWNQHITCHTLRHSFASYHMNNGVPIVQIQQWLGHESLASTGIYAHLESERITNPQSAVL